MATIANRRSVMILFSEPTCPYSHRTRIVLAEKDITIEIENVDPTNKPEDLLSLNPYGVTPTLVDRDLVLYNSEVIMEYLDERFPHPPLLPVDPVSRAKCRLALFRIEHDWYGLLNDLASDDSAVVDIARKRLKEGIIEIAPILDMKPYFLSDEFGLADCYIAPILWRLGEYGINLPSQAKSVARYAKRIFARPSFQESLSDAEREMLPYN